MKPFVLFFFTLLLFPFFSGTKSIKEKPSGLMVEFIRDPSGVPVLDLKPEFSWTVPQSAQYQGAYRILVASSEEKIKKDLADIWDSGKTKGSLSTEVEFVGGSLKPNTSYCWKVMIWDDKDSPSAYSEMQSFRTGSAVNYLTTQNRFVTTPVSPASFSKTGEGHYFVDFGKDAFGTVLLRLNPLNDDTVVIHLGEKLSAKDKIDREPGGSIRYQKVLLPVKKGTTDYTLNLARDARNTGPAAVHLPDSLGIITPFRYCEVENCPGVLEPSDITQKTVHVYFDERAGSFTSSDTVLNQIWDLCKYSMKATSFAGIYVDGDRERIPYEADAYINQLGHYYTDCEYTVARLTNEYFINHPTWPTEWILHTVPMFYNDYMFTGNNESIKNYYEELKKKTLTSLAGEDGLISVKNCTEEIMAGIGFTNKKEKLRDIVDWPPAQKDTGWKLVTSEGERDGYDMRDVNTMVNAFYYRGLDCMAKIAVALGHIDDAGFYSKKASQLKEVFNEKLLDKAKGYYVDGLGSQHSSLHANMTALAFDLVPAKYIGTVVDFIKSRGMACSVYGSQYLMEALYRAGEAEYAMDLLTSTSDRSWWNMIRYGSTISMEAWDMKYKPNSDLNHAWGAAPANIIPGYMWGISPAEPGFAKAVIRPQQGSLKNSSISVPTIRGTIKAEFSDNGKTKEYVISIPGNMKCDLILNGINSVTLNKKKVNGVQGVFRLNPGINKIII